MLREDLFKKVIEWFEENNPSAKSELVYRNTYELLVAVILSAQCTDKRVNIVTPPFFKKFPNPPTLAKASIDDIFEYIHSVSYPNNKSKHLSGMGKMLVDKFGGEVPSQVEQLKELPGVGQKTANVIASVAFNQPKMAVDTHVFRVAARIGLSRNAKTPKETEEQLVRYIPTEKIGKAHHWLILHGRYVCKARKPLCEDCGLQPLCAYYIKERKKQ